MITTGDKVGKTLWVFGEEANTHMLPESVLMSNAAKEALALMGYEA